MSRLDKNRSARKYRSRYLAKRSSLAAIAGPYTRVTRFEWRQTADHIHVYTPPRGTHNTARARVCMCIHICPRTCVCMPGVAGGTERQRSDEGRSRTPSREAPAEHTSLERRALVYVGVTAFQLARRRRSDLEVAREHPSSTLRPRKF